MSAGPLDALPLKADQIEQHLTVHMRPGQAAPRCLVCRLLVTLALETTRADQWHEEAFARGVEMDRMEREHGAAFALAKIQQQIEAMGTLQREHQRRLDQALETERELIALLGQAEASIAALARERDLAHSTIEKLADKLDPWIHEDDVAIDALVLDAVDRLIVLVRS